MQEQEACANSKVEMNTQRDWIILAVFVLLGAGILTMPPRGNSNTVSAEIAGVCFGAAAMLMFFRFGKKPPENVK